MLTAELDTTRHQANLAALAAALAGPGGDCSALVRQEARLLTRTIANFTPPTRSKWGAPKVSGEKAIARELGNLFHQVQTPLLDAIGSRFGTKGIRADITAKDGRKIPIAWDNLDATGARMGALHQSQRNARGKVPLRPSGFPDRWQSRAVVPADGTLPAYVKSVQSRVGRAKASFCVAAAKLGETFPTWIRRHTDTVAPIAICDVSQAQHPTRPTVVFGSRAPGVDRLRPRVSAAVQFRAQVLARRLKLVVSGYSGDFARSVRAQSRAARTPPEPAAPVE